MCTYECASPADTITRGSTKLKTLSHTLAPLDSLAHDYNGLVARAHLHLLHQISHLQYTCGRLWHTILRPPHVLELSHSEAIITRRHGGLAVRDIHLPDNIVIAVFLCFEGYRVLSKQFTVSLCPQASIDDKLPAEISSKLWNLMFAFGRKLTRCATLCIVA